MGITEMPSSSIRNGVLVGAVHRAAVLHDAQPAGRELLGDAVVEHDDAVGDVLLETVAGERAVAALARDHRGDPAVLEPAEQPAQLGAQHRGVGQSSEQRLDGVEHDALGADRVDRVAEADEKAAEVVLARLLDLGALDADVVDQQLPARDELFEIEAERADVLDQLLGGLLERHEHAGLAELGRPAHQQLHREQRLAAAGAAAHQRRPAARQAAAGDLVEAGDAGRGLGK
jgi:hypothetical protein